MLVCVWWEYFGLIQIEVVVWMGVVQLIYVKYEKSFSLRLVMLVCIVFVLGIVLEQLDF